MSHTKRKSSHSCSSHEPRLTIHNQCVRYFAVMASRHSTRPTRERILSAAKTLFQQRGYYAVGMAEILGAAGAPKGSMYHHFPEGKEQIAIEAVKKISSDVQSMTAQLADKGHSVRDIIRLLAKGMAHWLKSSQWREGTLLASVSVGAVPNHPKLHREIKAALDSWRAQLTILLIRERWARTAARSMADVIVSSMEGAMIVARIDRNARPLLRTARTLAQLLSMGARTAKRV